ncbi:MAG TPA: tRNA 4-thiouridine(8) synthase ThiI [Acholeplasmataceae bacterium]|nr:tRNA 4-thiouridine(8) synthase ThiI [Acholeplasmataceae bacterium]
MKVLMRFGDLMLKGRNKKMFINKIRSHVSNKFKNYDVATDFRHDRIYIDFDEQLLELVEKKINEIPGISSYSIIYVAENETEKIVELASNILNQTLDVKKVYDFKIETKRSNKRFVHTSQEFTKIVAPLILKMTNIELKVNVRNPEVTLNIDIRDDGTYIYLDKIKAMGGYPAGIAGKGLVMMSGGIDSPVASYLAIKQGVEVELLHFESSPMTPLESVNKVIDLATKLAVFVPGGKIKLHLVPFTEIHKEILRKLDNSYSITIMRRMMYRIAEAYASKNNIPIIINGESIGQVASQTLSSMLVVENVTRLPIIRPLATYDKQDIITISRKIDTYDISIKPFQDCCSIYVPQNPVINPTLEKCEAEESKGDFSDLIIEAVNNIATLVIKEDTKIELEMYGFDVTEALKNMREQK